MLATKAFLEIYYSNTSNTPLPVTSFHDEFNKQPTKPTLTSTSTKPTLLETMEKQPKDKTKTLQTKRTLTETIEKQPKDKTKTLQKNCCSKCSKKMLNVVHPQLDLYVFSTNQGET